MSQSAECGAKVVPVLYVCHPKQATV